MCSQYSARKSVSSSVNRLHVVDLLLLYSICQSDWQRWSMRYPEGLVSFVVQRRTHRSMLSSIVREGLDRVGLHLSILTLKMTSNSESFNVNVTWLFSPTLCNLPCASLFLMEICQFKTESHNKRIFVFQMARFVNTGLSIYLLKFNNCYSFIYYSIYEAFHVNPPSAKFFARV